jgi:hypothetical protein
VRAYAVALIKVLRGLGGAISTSAENDDGQVEGNGSDPMWCGVASGLGSVQVDDELGERRSSQRWSVGIRVRRRRSVDHQPGAYAIEGTKGRLQTGEHVARRAECCASWSVTSLDTLPKGPPGDPSAARARGQPPISVVGPKGQPPPTGATLWD